MKYSIASFMFLFSSVLWACPNFSGEFVNEEFGTYYSITQESCDLIDYHYDEGVVEAHIDGKEYLINSYEIVLEEGKVLATVNIYSSFEFKGNKLIKKERSETIYTNGEILKDQGRSESYLNKTNDLVTTSYGQGKKQTNVDKRVK